MWSGPSFGDVTITTSHVLNRLFWTCQPWQTGSNETWQISLKSYALWSFIQSRRWVKSIVFYPNWKIPSRCVLFLVSCSCVVSFYKAGHLSHFHHGCCASNCIKKLFSAVVGKIQTLTKNLCDCTTSSAVGLQTQIKISSVLSKTSFIQQLILDVSSSFWCWIFLVVF